MKITSSSLTTLSIVKNPKYSNEIFNHKDIVLKPSLGFSQIELVEKTSYDISFDLKFYKETETEGDEIGFFLSRFIITAEIDAEELKSEKSALLQQLRYYGAQEIWPDLEANLALMSKVKISVPESFAPPKFEFFSDKDEDKEPNK